MADVQQCTAARRRGVAGKRSARGAARRAAWQLRRKRNIGRKSSKTWVIRYHQSPACPEGGGVRCQ